MTAPIAALNASVAAAQSGSLTNPTGSAAGQRAEVHRVAQEFETMLLRQLLTSAKVTGSDDQGAYNGMAQDALAQGIEQGGGLGLARELERSLASALHDTHVNPPAGNR